VSLRPFPAFQTAFSHSIFLASETQGESQCLQLDQPAQTEVVVGYRLLNSGANIRAVVEQSGGKTPLFDRALPVSGDHFEFTTAADGLTTVCLSNEGSGMAVRASMRQWFAASS
jgi:hypothetical protein